MDDRSSARRAAVAGLLLHSRAPPSSGLMNRSERASIELLDNTPSWRSIIRTKIGAEHQSVDTEFIR